MSSSFVPFKDVPHVSQFQEIKFVQVKRDDFVEPTKYSVICGAHFTSDCFEGVYNVRNGFKK